MLWQCIELVTVEGEDINDLFLLWSITDGVSDQRGRHFGAALPVQYGFSRTDRAWRNSELMRLCLFEAAIQQVWIFMNGRLLVGIELVTTNDG